MRSLSRATAVFATALFAVAGFGWFAHGVLHLDCLGPVLPAWGCLAAPYPQVLIQAGSSSTTLLRLLLLGVALWLLCFAGQDLVLSGLSRLIRLLLPGRLERRQEPPLRTYRLR